MAVLLGGAAWTAVTAIITGLFARSKSQLDLKLELAKLEQQEGFELDRQQRELREELRADADRYKRERDEARQRIEELTRQVEQLTDSLATMTRRYEG